MLAREGQSDSASSTKPRSERPVALAPIPENVPGHLRRLPRWVNWQYQWKNDRYTKVPLRTDGGGNASASNPETWSTFDDALQRYQTKNIDGIGFVIGEGLVGIDIDHCRNPDTGELTPEARVVITTLNTYTEISPSGTGIRAFALGELPAGGRKRDGFEMYDGEGGRYLTVTGHQIDGTPSTIERRDTELAAVHARWIAKPLVNPNTPSVQPPTGSGGNGLTDTEVLEAMWRSRHGPRLRSLYDGDTSAHGGDHSAADLALVSHFVWWTDGDATQVDRLFRSSALMRDKWDSGARAGETYGEGTIREALQKYVPGTGYRGAAHAGIRVQSTADGRSDSELGTQGGSDAGSDSEPLTLPPGWRWENGDLQRCTEPDRNGESRWIRVYTGHLAVIAIGEMPDGSERLTVEFSVGRARRTVTAPRSDLVRGPGVLDCLGKMGANVHDRNARDVAKFVTEYASRNADALPRERLTDRLGVTPHGIIGPDWAVGDDSGSIKYVGTEMQLTVRSDRGAYLDGVREMASWETSTWLPRAVLGLVAASPHLKQLGLLRNPVIGIGGPSNIGKGTITNFAFGLFAEPAHPFMISGIQTSQAAILQVFTKTNGLPVWIDEAQQLPPYLVTNCVYAFANKQMYARGGRDGNSKGGEPLSGALILTGEGLAELRTTGARNRVLVVDANRHYPLGSQFASQRAQVLERATRLGAGSVGCAVTRHLWQHRETWWNAVNRRADQLQSDASAWHLPAAAIETTLSYLCDALGLPADPGIDGLAARVLAAVSEGWREVDPARDAFERVRDAVIAARSVEGVRRGRNDSVLARVVRVNGMDAWAVRSTAPEVEDVLEPYQGARVVAPLWAQRGWILPGTDGKTTRVVRLVPGDNAPVRCFVFPIEVFEVPSDEDTPPPHARVEGVAAGQVN